MFANIQKDNEQNTTFLNPYSYNLARKNKKLFSQFNIKIDGILLVKMLNIFGFKNIKRESFDMTSLAPIVFNNAIEKNKTIYFIGTKPKIIDKAVENIQKEFKGLNILGYRNGYIKVDEKYELLENIKNSNPDIVICGMGTISQEQFLVDLQNHGWSGKGYTCGGFLHQTAENIRYYPNWIDKFNLRLFYRFYKEPHLYKRYFIEYPLFFIYITYDFIVYKKGI